jgi:hypothetical protein
MGILAMRKRNRVLIGLVIIILVVSLASAWLILFSTPASSSLSASSSVSHGFQLTITLDANTTQYTKGETVPITFTVTNLANQTQNFTNTNGNADFNFQIYDRSNKEVYSWIHGAYPLTNGTVTIAPNGTYSQTLNWAQDEDVSSGFSPVPSATYYIIGEIGANTPYQLQTQPLDITIC